jgi:hypothetical protein
MSNILTTDTVLELADVAELEDVRALNASNRCLWNLSVPGTVDFGRLVRLEKLDLSNNKLRSVDEILCISTLRELNVDNNYIQDISGFLNFPNLQLLSTRNNVIDNVKYIHTLKFLQSLSLSGNCLIVEEACVEFRLCHKLEILDIGEFFEYKEYIPWLKVLDGQVLETTVTGSAYDHLLLSKATVSFQEVSLEDRVTFLEGENARLQEDIARFEDDAEVLVLRAQVAALRVLADENNRLKVELETFKRAKPVNLILARQLSKISSRPQTPVTTFTPREPSSGRPSTALTLAHVVEETEDLDKLLEESERNLIEAELALAETQKQFSCTRASTAGSELA